jgi:hypothetical protein
VTVFVDPWARRVVKTIDPRDYSAGEGIAAWQHAVHSGIGAGPIRGARVFLTGFLPLLFQHNRGVDMVAQARQAADGAGAAGSRLRSVVASGAAE